MLTLLALSGVRARAAVEVQLSPSAASPQPVGTTVVWTASASDANSGTFEYQFSVRPPGGDFALARDFAPSDSFEWTPSDREGTFDIRVNVRNTTTHEDAQLDASYAVSSRVSGSDAVVSGTSNPMVALYSAPACDEGSMRVRFWRAGDLASQATPWKSCRPGVSMNFYVAGMLAATEYSMRHETSSDPAAPPTKGPTLTFLTGVPPANSFPDSTVVAPSEGESGQDVLLSVYVFLGRPALFSATDLSGRLLWYYGRAAAPTRPCDGGTILTIANTRRDSDTLREFDLAGNTVRETNADVVSEQLRARGGRRINTFHHEANRLPDGRTVVLASADQTLTDVQGPGPVNILSDTIIVLDRNWQVVWYWDAFDHLDVTRRAILNERCARAPGCPTTAATTNDWLHSNAVTYVPADGNLLLSIRHQDWVIKIDYRDGNGTGDVLWRLGKDGDFTIDSTDPYPWFSHQHDAKFEPDGTLTLFDNGNTRQIFPNATANSRGQVLKLDETARTATLQLNADLGGYSFALGSAQRLAGGNYHFLAGWLPGNVAQSIEVNPDGARAYALQSQSPTYRSFRMKDLYTPGPGPAAGMEEQSITFDAVADHTYGDSPFEVSATASSGLPVGFGVVSGPATVSGNTVTLTGAGTVVLQADQDGNIKYEQAPSVRRTFAVDKAPATITLGDLKHTYDGTPKGATAAIDPTGLNMVSLTYRRDDVAVAAPTDAGSYQVTAALVNDNYQAAEVTDTLVIAKAEQTISFDAPPDKTFGDDPFALSATASSGLPVIPDVVSGPATIVDGMLIITGAGTVNVRASQPGNANYEPAEDAQRSFRVAKTDQTITFGNLTDKTFGVADFTVSATASSSLSVKFTASGQCTVSGSIVHLTGAGSCTITASQAGGDNHNPAPDVSRTFSVAKAAQTITFGTLADKTFGDDPFTISATGGASGNAVTFTSQTPTFCSVGGGTLTILAAGSCTVRASQAGNSNYNAAADVDRSFQIAKAKATITLQDLSQTYDGTLKAVTATTSPSGLGVVSIGYKRNGAAVAAPTDAGSYDVTASLSNVNYTAADATATLVIAKAGQTVTFNVLPDRTFGDAPFTLNATSSSGLPVSFRVVSGPASLGGDTLAITGAGTITVRASQDGDANFSAAPSVTRSFTAAKAGQIITFPAINDRTFGDPDFTLSATADSGLGVSYSAKGACSVSGATVHLTSAGSCTITASQDGGDNYEAAADARQSFRMAKASTNTMLSSSALSPPAGQGVTFTAVVASAAGNPSGSVQFKSDGATLSAPVALDAAGVAALTTSALAAGAHVITAEYGGATNFDASGGVLSGGQLIGSLFEFSRQLYSAAERAGSVSIYVRRTGDTSRPASVDYSTDDGDAAAAAPCSAATGVALERCDYTLAGGTLRFAAGETEKSFVVLLSDDSYGEGTETTQMWLANPSDGATLARQSSAALEIEDDASESATNPIDDDRNFVRQHYADFLNRAPDDDGLAFWTSQTTNCGNPSREVCHINVSAAFFLSIEFQQTGYLVERFYKTAYGDAAGASTLGGAHQLGVPVVRLSEFLPDTQQIGRGVVVGQGDWQARLEENKQAFALEFVRRPVFLARYPTRTGATAFVNLLDANAGGVLSPDEKAALVNELSPSPSDAARRASVLRKVAEDADLLKREYNRAFVLMQYFGYLRRDPDAAPDRDHTGYDFWLRKLEQFDGDFVAAEMAKAFINSDEYRQRFGR